MLHGEVADGLRLRCEMFAENPTKHEGMLPRYACTWMASLWWICRVSPPIRAPAIRGKEERRQHASWLMQVLELDAPVANY